MTEPDGLHRTASDDPVPEGGARDLDAAAAQLRGRTESLPPLTVERMLRTAWTAPRMSQLLRASPPHDYLRVSTTTLVALIRQRVDEGLAHAAVRRLVCRADREERLESVTLELVVQYGHDAREACALAHVAVAEVVAQTLGEVLPHDRIRTGHVHVADVTVGDPHLVDPRDEA